MHEHEKDDPEVLSEIEELGYDPRDVDVDKTPMHAAYLYGFVLFSIFLAWFVMWMLDSSQVSTVEPTEVVRDHMPEESFPLIQSNITAKKDIEDLRALEHVMTDTAGWVDKEAGVARIPVETAIGLMLEEGFETRRSSDSIVLPADELAEEPSDETSDVGAQPEGVADTETEE